MIHQWRPQNTNTNGTPQRYMHHWRFKRPNKDEQSQTPQAGTPPVTPQSLGMEECTGHWKYSDGNAVSKKNSALDQSVSAPVSPSNSRHSTPHRTRSNNTSPLLTRPESEPNSRDSLPSFQWALQHTQAVKEQHDDLRRQQQVPFLVSQSGFPTSFSAPVTPVQSRSASPSRFGYRPTHPFSSSSSFFPPNVTLPQFNFPLIDPHVQNGGMIPNVETHEVEEEEEEEDSSMDIDTNEQGPVVMEQTPPVSCSPRSRVAIHNLVSSGGNPRAKFTRQRSNSDLGARGNKFSAPKTMSINNIVG